jgi:carbon monoxide dehydrogenase subunit G
MHIAWSFSKIPMTNTSIRIEYRYTLHYSRDHVWEKLNDPNILSACIKGCESVTRESSTKFRAVIRAHLGEIKKDFSVDLDVDDKHAPAKYTLGSVVSAGLLGKVKGLAEVDLKEEGENQSLLYYVATIEGGGFLGKALPLIEGAAIRRVHDFFDKFVDHLAG